MNGTYILSDFKPLTKEIIRLLGIVNENIISSQSFDNESGYHDWITEIFKKFNITKLIIPLDLNASDPMNDGLKIALHIRLNYELTIAQRTIPITILSDFSIEVILRNNNFDSDNNPQNLLFTKGIYLSIFDADQIHKTISEAESCSERDYNEKILGKLKINQKASIGKHSIANAWGCFKLAQVTGQRDEIFKLTSVSGHLKTLYAKYLICINDSFKEDKDIDRNPINAGGKKVLFIDDQADEGWSVLMKNIFKSAGNSFVAVDSSKYKNSETNKFHAFEGFYAECQTHIGKDWDLIIIDLRLNPEKEDIDNELLAPTEFSGYKLIDEFLKANAGYQIVVSTASNKIWNINAALKRGAVSYYVKESPEFNYKINETRKQYESFKNDLEDVFENKYLWTIWDETQQCIKHLQQRKREKIVDKDFVGAICIYLQLAFDSLNNKRASLKTTFALQVHN